MPVTIIDYISWETPGMYKAQSYIIYPKSNKKFQNPTVLQDFNKNNLTAGIELGSIYDVFIQKNKRSLYEQK